jgi:hypothetical protein
MLYQKLLACLCCGSAEQAKVGSDTTMGPLPSPLAATNSDTGSKDQVRSHVERSSAQPELHRLRPGTLQLHAVCIDLDVPDRTRVVIGPQAMPRMAAALQGLARTYNVHYRSFLAQSIRSSHQAGWEQVVQKLLMNMW